MRGGRREEAGVPEGVVFRTRPELALEIVQNAAAGGVPFQWVGGDSAFDLTQEAPAMRERYGMNPHGQSVLQARRLVEAGVPLVTIYWPNDGIKNVSVYWDTHSRNFIDHRERLMPPADQAFSTLLDDLGELATSGAALRQLDYLFEHPIISIRMAETHLGCSYVTAANAVQDFERLGILREITGQQRNRRYRYDPYLTLFDRQVLAEPGESESREVLTTVGRDGEEGKDKTS